MSTRMTASALVIAVPVAMAGTGLDAALRRLGRVGRGPRLGASRC